MSTAAIRTEYGPQGEVLHVVPCAPPDLPTVSRFHLEQAWDAARAGAGLRAGKIHGFRFHCDDAAPLELLLADHDAASWTGGIERIADLSTAYGISLCLRLLALVTLMANAQWLRPWFSLPAGRAQIHPALLQAAALTPLTQEGGFDETMLRALLPAGF